MKVFSIVLDSTLPVLQSLTSILLVGVGLLTVPLGVMSLTRAWLVRCQVAVDVAFIARFCE